MILNSRVNSLNTIKNDIVNKKLFIGDEINSKVDALIGVFWNDRDREIKNKDLHTMNLDDINKLHEFLIKELIQIHRHEESEINKLLMSTNTKLNSILREGIDGKRAYDIYLLNEECEYIFIGDLHSDDMSLQRALKEVDFYNKVTKDEIRLVFTGDYVDRGHTHLKVLERVMILKYLYPKNVFLIRGNHDGGVIEEDGSITLPYKAVGQDINELYFPYYLRELSRVNKSFDKALLPLYLEFFNSLAYVCGVYNDKLTIMAVHGGIPRGRIQENGEGMYTHLKCFADITSKDIRDELGNDMTNNIIWSDPYRGIGEIRSKNRRFHFTNDQFNSFKDRFGFDLLIRGHEECEEGFRYHFNNELVTIFSSGGQHFYCDKNFGPNKTNDESAYENILPRVLSVVPKGEIRFI